jgi:penicillin-binding protein-related factor A (putative recombinase)
MLKQSEKEIENAILEYLSLQRDVFAWKVNTVGVFDPVKAVFRKSKNRFHMNGVADILGIFMGKPLAIEVKSQTGRLSPAQHAFLNRFITAGGVAIMARSVDDVVISLEHVRKNVSCRTGSLEINTGESPC